LVLASLTVIFRSFLVMDERGQLGRTYETLFFLVHPEDYRYGDGNVQLFLSEKNFPDLCIKIQLRGLVQ